MMNRIRRGISFILIAALIICLASGCGKAQNSAPDPNEKSNEDVEVSTETGQEHDFWKLLSKEDHKLTLMYQHLEVPGTDGEYYNRLAVTGGDNELVKNIIENSMQDLENQVIENGGFSSAAVLRNDDVLLSYVSLCEESNYSYTDYCKTIDVVNGKELELSDIIVDMEMLPKAMYAEAYQVRDDYDDFIDYINDLIEQDMLYWYVNDYGIFLIPDKEYTVNVLYAGRTHPVTAYGFTIFLSCDEYPQLFNSSYFDGTDSEMSMSTLSDYKITLSDNDYDILLNNETTGAKYYGYNTIFYAQDLNLFICSDEADDSSDLNQLFIFDIVNNTRCTVNIGDTISYSGYGVPYLAEIHGKKFLLFGIYYSKRDQINDVNIFSAETFVFQINDNNITMTDRVTGLLNYGGGEMSPNGFYINSHEEIFETGLDEAAWNSLPMYMLTDQGKIVQKK